MEIRESLSDDEIDLLRTLHVNNGFNVYLSLLRRQFAIEYKRLRMAKDMKDLDSTNGYLSGLEYAMNAVMYELEDGNNSPQDVA